MTSTSEAMVATLQTKGSYALLIGSEEQAESGDFLTAVTELAAKGFLRVIVSMSASVNLKAELKKAELTVQETTIDQDLSPGDGVSLVTLPKDLGAKLQSESVSDWQSFSNLIQSLRPYGVMAYGLKPKEDFAVSQLCMRAGRLDLPLYVLYGASDAHSTGNVAGMYSGRTVVYVEDKQLVDELNNLKLRQFSIRKEAGAPDGPPTQVRILAIDGGGIRGVIPAMILAAIEGEGAEHVPISQQFDLISGTSTGGILALGLSLPEGPGSQKPKYSAQQLAQLYRVDGPKIFPKNADRYDEKTNLLINALSALRLPAAQQLLGVIKSALTKPFPEKGLEEVLDQYFGSSELKDVLCDVLITSYEIEQRRNFYWKRRDARSFSQLNAAIKDVIRSTTAAPTYFRPKKIEGRGMPPYFAMIDGGMFANNPALCALIEAKALFPYVSDFLVVSVGTGESAPSYDLAQADNWKSAEWINPLIQILFHGSSTGVDENLGMLIPDGADHLRRYYRFQVKLDPGLESIDDASEANITKLSQCAQKFLATEGRRDLQELRSQLRIKNRLSGELVRA